MEPQRSHAERPQERAKATRPLPPLETQIRDAVEEETRSIYRRAALSMSVVILMFVWMWCFYTDLRVQFELERLQAQEEREEILDLLVELENQHYQIERVGKKIEMQQEKLHVIQELIEESMEPKRSR